MLTTLTIKKKYLYFFPISIILAIITVIFLNSSDYERLDPLSEKCENFDLKIDYYYKKSWGRKGDSYIHNILKEYLKDELILIIKDEKSFEFDGDNLYFLSSECEKHHDKVISEYSSIYTKVVDEMLDWYVYLEENTVSLTIYDEHIFYSILNENAFKILPKEEILNVNQASINLIRFIFILLLLNLIYFLYTNINIKIK